MIDIEHFTKIFYSLGEIDQSIVKKYIHGDSIRNISRCLGYSTKSSFRRFTHNDRLGTDNNKAAGL